MNDRIIDVLCEEWERTAPNVLDSETVYDRLLEEGWRRLGHEPRDTGVPRGWQKPVGSRGGVLYLG